MDNIRGKDKIYSAPKSPDGRPEADVFIMHKIPENNLPVNIKELFYSPSARFDECLKLPTVEGISTFVVLSSLSKGKRITRKVRVVDTFEGRIVASSSFGFSQLSDSQDAALQDAETTMSETEEGFGQRGLGERRLIILDQLSQSRWGVPVNSSTTPSPSAAATWDNVVERGYAIFDEEEKVYRFLPHEK